MTGLKRNIVAVSRRCLTARKDWQYSCGLRNVELQKSTARCRALRPKHASYVKYPAHTSSHVVGTVGPILPRDRIDPDPTMQLCLFLPRCIECRRGLAMRILSVCPSVCMSNAWIVTKRKKNQSRFLCHTKEHLA